MKESIICYGKYEKPGKYEVISFFPNRIKSHPDVDKKRITVCKDLKKK